jgi:hypothetical protein
MPLKDAPQTGMRLEKLSTAIPVLFTSKEAATLLKLSRSWLDKARMRGDGPPTSGSVDPFGMPRWPSSSG